MSVTLDASACPAVAFWSVLTKLSDAYASSSGIGFGAKGVAQGEMTTLRPKWNQNALAIDLSSRWGGGVYAIGYGLSFTCAGLVVTVAAGQAIIEGITELSAPATAALTNNTRNYVWLSQSAGGVGSVLVVGGSTAAPNSKAVFLGSVQVTAGVPGTVDTSGVVYSRGNMLYRETADALKPSDSPDSSVGLYTKTAGGLYIWLTVWYGPISAAP